MKSPIVEAVERRRSGKCESRHCRRLATWIAIRLGWATFEHSSFIEVASTNFQLRMNSIQIETHTIQHASPFNSSSRLELAHTYRREDALREGVFDVRACTYA